jgi:hypothetical protein
MSNVSALFKLKPSFIFYFSFFKCHIYIYIYMPKRKGKLTYKNKNKNKNKNNKRKTVKHRKNKFIKLNCAPKVGNKLNFSCFTADALHILKKIWNARHNDVKIHSNDPKEIWQQFRNNMSNTCNSEACWLRHQCIKNKIPHELWENIFAPNAPKEWLKNPQEWLTSIEIEKVMQQWERVYKCFEFIGPSPIDYDKHKLFGECVWEDLCRFSLLDMKKRHKNKIGVIFNLDPHDKDGSHWVALFINLKKQEIYYFDSYGEEIPRRINKFVKMVIKQAKNLNENYELKVITKRHQYSQSECGMYSLYFIIEMLKDKPFSYFQNNKIPDKKMIALRNKYFNKNN